MEDRITPPAAPARRTSSKCGKYRVDAEVALKTPRPCLQHGGCCLHPSYPEIALRLLEERGSITIAELAAECGCKYRTASATLRDLISSTSGQPIVRRVAKGRYALNLPDKNGAPRSESITEAAPGAGNLAVADGLCGERGIRTPDTLAGTPDFESGASSSDGNGSGEEGSDDDGEPPLTTRAMRLAALAWDLVERDPQLAARVAFDLVELDEHDPVACIAACCNSPLALEVRP